MFDKKLKRWQNRDLILYQAFVKIISEMEGLMNNFLCSFKIYVTLLKSFIDYFFMVSIYKVFIKIKNGLIISFYRANIIIWRIERWISWRAKYTRYLQLYYSITKRSLVYSTTLKSWIYYSTAYAWISLWLEISKIPGWIKVS